jgi:hypothetical protein
MIMRNGVEKSHHPNGKVASEVTYANGLPNGVTRAWHPNGALASEIPVKNGVAEGVAKYWDEKGKLLGSYEIRNGNGVQKSWFPNGNLKGEITLVNGQWTGRQLAYFEDGALAGESYYIRNAKVSKKKYDEACKKDPALPRYKESQKPKASLPTTKYQRSKSPVSEEKRSQHEKFIAEFRAKPNQVEARQWLAGGESRFLGEMTPEASRDVVEDGYKAGASKITAVGVQGETTSCLIVELPPKGAERKRVFEWNNELAQSSGFDPDVDWGQNELFVFFD